MAKNPHHGSSFDDFLAEEGLLEEVTYGASRKIVAFQIAAAMKTQGKTKTALAAQMGTTRAELESLLDHTMTT